MLIHILWPWSRRGSRKFVQTLILNGTEKKLFQLNFPYYLLQLPLQNILYILFLYLLTMVDLLIIYLTLSFCYHTYLRIFPATIHLLYWSRKFGRFSQRFQRSGKNLEKTMLAKHFTISIQLLFRIGFWVYGYFYFIEGSWKDIFNFVTICFKCNFKQIIFNIFPQKFHLQC